MTAWVEASPTTGGPGNGGQTISRGLKGRHKFCRAIILPIQGKYLFLGQFPGASPRAVMSWAFSPLQAETAAEAFKGEL